MSTSTRPYLVTAPRTPQQAIEALLPPDADYTLALLLDAMRALPQFSNPDTAITENRAVIGDRKLWKYAEARTIIRHALGGEADEHLVRAMAIYRTVAVNRCDDVFMLRLAFILKGGWTNRYAATWWDPFADVWLSLELVSGWLGSWSIASLDSCYAAGMREPELRSILNSGILPDPEGIATLIALHTDDDA